MGGSARLKYNAKCKQSKKNNNQALQYLVFPFIYRIHYLKCLGLSNYCFERKGISFCFSSDENK